jgi:hypothetical protein
VRLRNIVEVQSAAAAEKRQKRSLRFATLTLLLEVEGGVSDEDESDEEDDEDADDVDEAN